MGRRVLITGVSGYLGNGAGTTARARPEIRVHCGARRAAAWRRTSSARSSSAPTSATRCSRSSLPQTSVDTVVHCDVLLAPEPGKAAEAAARHQRDRVAAAPRRVREGGDGAHDHRRGSAAIYGAEPNAPSVLHRGDGTALSAAHPVPARHRRARELLRDLHARRYPRHDGDRCCAISPRWRATRLAADSATLRSRSCRSRARLRSAAPVRSRARTRSPPSRRPYGGRSGAVNVAGEGSVSLCRLLRLAGTVPLPVLAPLFGTRRAGRAARTARLLPGGGALASLRCDGRHPPDRRGRFRPRSTARRRSTTSSRRCAAVGRCRRPWRPPGPSRPRKPATDTPRAERARRLRVTSRNRHRAVPREARERARTRRCRAARAALGFLALLRAARARGLDLPAAVERAAGSLPPRPATSRDAARAPARGERGGRVGLRRGVRRARLPVLRAHVRALVASRDRRRRERAGARPAMLVANHAGVLPWDATMMSVAILKRHPVPRHPRFMVLDWAFRLPWVSAFMRRSRRRGRLSLQRDAPARARPPGDGVPRRREGRGQAVLGAVPPAAVRARRLRRDRAADRRADRAGRRRGLRGDLPEDRASPGCWRA